MIQKDGEFRLIFWRQKWEDFLETAPFLEYTLYGNRYESLGGDFFDPGIRALFLQI